MLPGIFWDAKYATEDNFIDSVVDGYCANRIVGTCELAAALSPRQLKAQRFSRPDDNARQHGIIGSMAGRKIEVPTFPRLHVRPEREASPPSYQLRKMVSSGLGKLAGSRYITANPRYTGEPRRGIYP